MNRCKYCGKPLTLTPEFDTCMECQGRIMREATMPQNSFTTNSTKSNMSIYDEKKVITHEEMREVVQFSVSGLDMREKAHKYINQQEKKEERAKKVEELVGLYRRRPLYINSVQFDEIDKLIKLKEKELRELK